ncbi:MULTISPECIES: DUF2249 domain-containing protein [unclassified Rhizobium]|uniref:DUF2249 domain-containing protein n=1 Tax=unclassified Rhizobium TaxID=2613769 RepID=UPI000CF22FDD|nr:MULTISPECIES: DUF2249 domain-containing protein [Rhizobium]UWU23992.1 DUF2249 domain-containing protein [Rhizobium tropici]
MMPLRELDVRQILREGGLPFQLIMDTIASLEPDEGLRLLAIFEPLPLIRQLKQRGYIHTSRQIDDDDWEIVFTPETASSSETQADASPSSADIWPDPVWNMDLTDLTPPEPMERILARLETMKAGEVLFALLSREPVFLFNELKLRGHEWVGNFDSTGSVFRIMIRFNPSEAAA